MVRYVGSKGRHAKHIVPHILEHHKSGKLYYEPFVGGGNLIWQVPIERRAGSDVDKYVIALLKSVAGGWVPPESISEAFYKDVMNNKDHYPDELVGFVGYCCSFGGKFFGGYARYVSKQGIPQNFAKQQVKTLMKQAEGLKGVDLFVADYREYSPEPGSTYYLDPPYEGTQGYGSKFDHKEFWEFASSLVSKGYTVLVSEYKIPESIPHKTLWQREVFNTLDLNTGGKKGHEKLFLLT